MGTTIESTHEKTLVHIRSNGERVEWALTHLANAAPTFQVAVFHENNPDEILAIGPVLSLDELKLEYMFLERLKALGYL